MFRLSRILLPQTEIYLLLSLFALVCYIYSRRQVFNYLIDTICCFLLDVNKNYWTKKSGKTKVDITNIVRDDCIIAFGGSSLVPKYDQLYLCNYKTNKTSIEARSGNFPEYTSKPVYCLSDVSCHLFVCGEINDEDQVCSLNFSTLEWCKHFQGLNELEWDGFVFLYRNKLW